MGAGERQIRQHLAEQTQKGGHCHVIEGRDKREKRKTTEQETNASFKPALFMDEIVGGKRTGKLNIQVFFLSLQQSYSKMPWL